MVSLPGLVYKSAMSLGQDQFKGKGALVRGPFAFLLWACVKATHCGKEQMAGQSLSYSGQERGSTGEVPIQAFKAHLQ